MAYEERYRERVLGYLGEGHTYREATVVFKVSQNTIATWKKLQKETGSLKKRALNRGFKKIDPEKLESYVEAHPDAYIREIAKEFGCANSAIEKALKRQKITRKKRSRDIASEMKISDGVLRRASNR